MPSNDKKTSDEFDANIRRAAHLNEIDPNETDPDAAIRRAAGYPDTEDDK